MNPKTGRMDSMLSLNFIDVNRHVSQFIKSIAQAH